MISLVEKNEVNLRYANFEDKKKKLEENLERNFLIYITNNISILLLSIPFNLLSDLH